MMADIRLVFEETRIFTFDFSLNLSYTTVFEFQICLIWIQWKLISTSTMVADEQLIHPAGEEYQHTVWCSDPFSSAAKAMLEISSPLFVFG